jgi:hypothetical protein
MEIAKDFEINVPSEPNKVWIATQGSPFKDTLVSKIVESLRSEMVHIKITDISSLNNIKIENWNAIIVIHTWEIGKPPLIVDQFIQEHKDSKKIIVFTTSGSKEETIKDIDGISGASIITQVPQYTIKILRRLNPLLPAIELN